MSTGLDIELPIKEMYLLAGIEHTFPYSGKPPSIQVLFIIQS